jgi:hypothetical protein
MGVMKVEVNSIKLMPVRAEPALVLAYLTACDMTNVAKSCVDAASACRDAKLFRRIAEDRSRDVASALEDEGWSLSKLDRLERAAPALGAWNVLCVNMDSNLSPVGVGQFPAEANFDIYAEIAYLINPERGIVVELRHRSTFAQWSCASESYQPMTCDSKTFGRRGKFLWDFEREVQPLGLGQSFKSVDCPAFDLRSDAVHRSKRPRLLPWPWMFGISDGGALVVGRFENVWIELTSTGFKTAERFGTVAIVCHEVTVETDASNAPTTYRLPNNSRGPWSTRDGPLPRGDVDVLEVPWKPTLRRGAIVRFSVNSSVNFSITLMMGHADEWCGTVVGHRDDRVVVRLSSGHTQFQERDLIQIGQIGAVVLVIGTKFNGTYGIVAGPGKMDNRLAVDLHGDCGCKQFHLGSLREVASAPAGLLA